jgi:hypothetical protein
MIKARSLSVFIAVALVMVAAASASAQMRLPRPSQWASVTQTIGVTDVTVNYSRPAVKGRTIWGEAPKDSYAKGEATLDDSNKRPEGMAIVPFGHVWRTGANEATQFVVTDDVTINGQKLAAGKYSLHTIPGKDEWTIIFNSDAGQWGSFSYEPSKDVLRVKAKPVWVNDSQEFMNFSIEPTSDRAAVVNLRWEKVRVPFTVDVDVPTIAMAKAKAAVAAAKADDWRTPLNAAGYARSIKADAEATAFVDMAVKAADNAIAAKPTYQAYVGKFNVLWNAGRKDEAWAVADKAIAQGKADNVDTAQFEKRIAELKAAK